MKRTVNRAAVAGRVFAAVTVAGVLAAPAASAHVTANPGEATKGGYATVNFRVPNEVDDASTVEIEVSFPAEEHPIRSVRVEPKPGWDYELETIEASAEAAGVEDSEEDTIDVVSKVTWTGGEIGPGEFMEFGVSMGRLPEDADELAFPTIQTMDDGESREWVEEGEDASSPAPTLTLVESEEGGHGGGGDDAEGAGEEEAAAPSLENVASEDDVSSANTLAIVGILLGLAGVATGAFSLLRGRRA